MVTRSVQVLYDCIWFPLPFFIAIIILWLAPTNMYLFIPVPLFFFVKHFVKCEMLFKCAL